MHKNHVNTYLFTKYLHNIKQKSIVNRQWIFYIPLSLVKPNKNLHKRHLKSSGVLIFIFPYTIYHSVRASATLPELNIF